MKEIYIAPEVEIVKFDSDDVIVASKNDINFPYMPLP